MNLSPFAIRFGTALEDAARAVGLVFEDRPPNPHYWDGKTCALRYRVTGRERSLSDLFHDLAHFQVAPKRRRFLPEFGLGAFEPMAVEDMAKKVVSRGRSKTEEARAFVLGYLWIYPLIPKSVKSDLIALHGYDDWEDFVTTCKSHIDWLVKHGLVKEQPGEFVPVAALRGQP